MSRGNKIPELNIEYCNNSTIFAILETYSYDDIKKFDELYMIYFKNRRDKQSRDIGFKLRVGDKVTVTERGLVRNGEIIRVKRTKALVKIQGTVWDVPITMIKKV